MVVVLMQEVPQCFGALVVAGVGAQVGPLPLNYVKRVRNGGVLTASGRPIPASQESPAFCHIVADLTPTLVSRCEYANLRRTHDGLGYFGFNESTKAYIEVISFDRLVNAATERNRAFFDKLGLPSG